CGGSMKKLILGVAIFMVCGSAFAGETPIKNWDGFYLGGNLGAVHESASGTSDFLDTGLTAFHTNPQNNSFSNTRFIGGVSAGYNWQFAPRWVAGIEADWDFTHLGYSFCRQTNAVSVACRDNGFGFESASSTTDWVATARARIGFTLDNFLLYGTGGAALGRVETTLTQSCLVAGCGASSTQLLVSSSNSTNKVGWVAGLGAEAALFGNWSGKFEWLHVDLGTISNSLTAVGSSGTQTTTWSRTERY